MKQKSGLFIYTRYSRMAIQYDDDDDDDDDNNNNNNDKDIIDIITGLII